MSFYPDCYVLSTCKGATLLLDVLCEVGGEDLDHGLAGQLVHGVVLVVAAGEVTEHVPGQLVDPLDDLGHVVLEVLGSQQGLELLNSDNKYRCHIIKKALHRASRRGSCAPTPACRGPRRSWCGGRGGRPCTGGSSGGSPWARPRG